MRSAKSKLKPAQLLVEHSGLFLEKTLLGPVLDLACGEAHNSIYLVLKGVKVISGDLSIEALERAGELAAQRLADGRWILNQRESIPCPSMLAGQFWFFAICTGP